MEILGIDIGGSGMKGALVNVITGEMVSERFRMATPKPSKPGPMRDVVREVVEHFNWKGPVGCSFPTVVKRGMAHTSGNISPDWVGIQVDQFFAEGRGGQQFFVGNDADLAGIAEMQFGAGQGHGGKVLMLTVGTGIGSGLFFEGHLVPNLELGFLLRDGGERIELWAADSARKREGLELHEWAERFDVFLNYAVRIIHPNLIIMGGGISKKMDDFRQYFTTDVPIEVAHFRNNAGIIGAAVFAHRELNS